MKKRLMALLMGVVLSLGFCQPVSASSSAPREKTKEYKVAFYFAIFMDMQMPVMDGIEATRRIRSSEREDRDVLIFAVTANTLTKDQQVCEEVGMNGYIPKPIKLKEIESAIREKMVAM